MKYIFLFCSFLWSTTLVFIEAQNLNNSQLGFVLSEKDLLPESIAYDSKTGDFYIGSTRKGKVVKKSRDGSITDFIKSGQSGLWMVVGLKIDAQRRILWVCSSGGDNLEGYTLKDDYEGRPAGVFKFNLETGKLIKKYILANPTEVHFFNDIVIKKNGDVYITHMFKEHAVFKITTKKDILEPAFSSEIIKYPNGLALSKDESKIYVAHSDGIAVININTGNTSSLAIPEGLKITRRESIDGLYYINNSLIGIQPDIKTVQRFQLDKDGTSIKESTLIEVNHPMMDNPTTGEIVNDMFYYIANAQFGSFDKNGDIFPIKQLYQPVILKTKLID